jgi:hypothetical protein
MFEGMIGSPKIIRKTADETVNNSDTLQNDDELKFAISANEVWAFILLPIIYTTDTASFKAYFTVPTNGNLYGSMLMTETDLVTYLFALFANSSYAIVGSQYNYAPMVVFGIIVNGDTAGNFQFQWAQNTAEESDTKVLANSCILAWRLA